ncbi:MAG: thiamine biosynthesis protein [Deltaproteobacteria bacterium]|nr:MAG: thiamine biosynthesis protein [Deltaproteobacteria bacterium]
MKKVKALALFSGGLDSILAARLVADQGVEVVALQFVTPFFHYDLLADVARHKKRVQKKYGLTVEVIDISARYLRLLRNPAHGFGKNFNPCIDCKILMFKCARELLAKWNASFLISGEVLGQRPMSQRRDTLNVIERESETRSLVLRPLSALHMPLTKAEERGWVDRSRLLKICGRGRAQQMTMAKQFNIQDYPAPAGGCILADPILSKRVRMLYAKESLLPIAEVGVTDVCSILVGRQLRLPEGGWLVLGRDERENEKLAQLVQPEDTVLRMEDWPGPTAVLKKTDSYCSAQQLEKDLALAASLVVRFGRKSPGQERPRTVSIWSSEGKKTVQASALADEVFHPWIIQ